MDVSPKMLHFSISQKPSLSRFHVVLERFRSSSSLSCFATFWGKRPCTAGRLFFDAQPHFFIIFICHVTKKCPHLLLESSSCSSELSIVFISISGPWKGGRD